METFSSPTKGVGGCMLCSSSPTDAGGGGGGGGGGGMLPCFTLSHSGMYTCRYRGISDDETN